MLQEQASSFSELFRDFSQKGFAKLHFNFSREEAQKIFSFFERICFLVQNEYDKQLASIDNVISTFILNSKTPIANETLMFKKIKNEFRDYDTHSYQYLEGLYGFVKENTINDAVSEDVLHFLGIMDYYHSTLRDHLIDLIDAIEKKVKCVTLFKVWRHTPKQGKEFLVPLHYDRSVFTSIVHTMNPMKECLRMGPPGRGEDIEEVRKTSSLDAYYRPSPDDFPLLLPGIYAKDYFDIHPTAHAVAVDGNMTVLGERFSLVFFIVPHGGIVQNEKHIVSENWNKTI